MWRFGIGVLLLGLGLILGLTALFTDVIYERTTALIIAGVLIFIGFFMLKRVRRGIAGSYDWQKEKRQWKGRSYVMILGVLSVILGLIIGSTIVIIIGAIVAVLYGSKSSGGNEKKKD